MLFSTHRWGLCVCVWFWCVWNRSGVEQVGEVFWFIFQMFLWRGCYIMMQIIIQVYGIVAKDKLILKDKMLRHNALTVTGDCISRICQRNSTFMDDEFVFEIDKCFLQTYEDYGQNHIQTQNNNTFWSPKMIQKTVRHFTCLTFQVFITTVISTFFMITI